MNFRREAKIGGVPPGGSGGWFRPLFSFFNNIANLLRVSSCIKHSHDDRPVGLFDEIDHVIRPLKKRTSDVAVFFGKASGFRPIPATVSSYFTRMCSSPIGSPRGIVEHRRAEVTFDFRQGKYWHILHVARSRRMSSACEIGLLLPAR